MGGKPGQAGPAGRLGVGAGTEHITGHCQGVAAADTTHEHMDTHRAGLGRAAEASARPEPHGHRG